MSTNTSGLQRGYELAYAEAQRWLEDQERTVVELRSRAGTLMAAATITTSFFGGQSLIRDDIGAPGWVAIGCFVLPGFALLLILWPSHDWEFSLAPRELIATYLEPVDGEPLETHLIQRDLALHMGRSAERNLDMRQRDRPRPALAAGHGSPAPIGTRPHEHLRGCDPKTSPPPGSVRSKTIRYMRAFARAWPAESPSSMVEIEQVPAALKIPHMLATIAQNEKNLNITSPILAVR